ncbi:MAG: hypothetical protein ABI780_00540 [Ardenticatenales bacterium]
MTAPRGAGRPGRQGHPLAAAGVLDRAFVVVLVLAALALRLHALDAQPLWSDEGLSLHRAGLGLGDLLRGRIVVDGFVTTDPMPPLYFVLLALARRALGPGIWAARFVAAALGVAVVPLGWLAGRRVAGRAAGLGAAVFTAISPLLVWYSQELRPYALLVAGVMAMTAIAAAGTPPVRRAMRWSLVVALTTALHPFALLAAAAQAPFVLPAAWRAAGARLRLAVALPTAAALAIALPGAVKILFGPAQVDFTAVSATMIASQALAAFAVGVSPSLGHPWPRIAPMAVLAVAGALAGLVDRRTRRGVGIAVAGCIGPLIALIGLSAFNPIYNGPRHAMAGLPAFLVLAAAAIHLPFSLAARRTLRGAKRPGRPGRPGRAVFILPMVAITGLAVASLAVASGQINRQFGSLDYVKDDIRSLVADLAVRVRGGDTIVLHDALIGFTFDAEAADLGVHLPWRAVPHFPTEAKTAADERLLALAPSGEGRLWFVDRPEPRGGFNRDHLVGVADDHWALLDRRQYHRMWLKVGLREYGGVAAPTPSTDRAPIAEWSNGLRLVQPSSPQSPAAPGTSLRILTRWQHAVDGAAEAAWELVLTPDDGPAMQIATDRLAPLASAPTPSSGSESGDGLTAGAEDHEAASTTASDSPATFASWLEAMLPVDAPQGPATIRLRLVDSGAGVPERVDAGAADAEEGDDARAVILGHMLISAPELSARTLRRLQVRRDGWTSAPWRLAGADPEWRFVAHTVVPATAKPAGAMALSVTWQQNVEVDRGRANTTARAALRLVDAAGVEVARASGVLPMVRAGGLATASITLAVPAGASGLLRVQAALGAEGDGALDRPFAVRGRWGWSRSQWIDIGLTDAVSEPSNTGAFAAPVHREGLSERRPSVTLAARRVAPPPEPSDP